MGWLLRRMFRKRNKDKRIFDEIIPYTECYKCFKSGACVDEGTQTICSEFKEL